MLERTEVLESQTSKPFDHYLRDEGEGLRGVDRNIFVNEALFDLEMKRIWERVWIYIAHESQLPKPKDFLTSWIGRVPVMVNRSKEGKLQAFVNSCTHRGATLCRKIKGNSGTFVCGFHGWAFNSEGKLLAPMNEKAGAYPPAFDKEQLGMKRVRLESYRGFLFATLNDAAEPLRDYLAESKTFIDMIVDQSPQGIEVLGGRSTYTFNANWKLQAENGVDGYHVASTHANYVETTKHRAELNRPGSTKTMNAGDIPKSRGGYYDLGNGHTILWSDWSNPQDRPIYARRDELIRTMGEERAEWAVSRMRNLLIYPSVFVMDQMSTQIRVFRPLTVNKTEVTIFCFAPKGEDSEVRNRRIRQYEDFFNASGMATPDDLTEFNECQKGCASHAFISWSEMSRGVMHEIAGADEMARRLNLQPVGSGGGVEDEGIMIAQHRRWRELMNQAEEQGAPR
jgi:benzoate/toluate 1,2-dioxygenase alpha subunit